MVKYEVLMETSAEADLFGILEYITNTLKAPVNAKRTYVTIREKLSTLETMPQRNRIIDEEPYKSMGIRPLYIENFIAFYDVDEDAHEVHVLRVVYNRRQWQNLL